MASLKFRNLYGKMKSLLNIPKFVKGNRNAIPSQTRDCVKV